MNAALGGYSDVVKQLLNEGANKAIVDRNGETALDMATREGHVRVIQEFKHRKNRNGQFDGLSNLGNKTMLKDLSHILNSVPDTSIDREGVYF